MSLAASLFQKIFITHAVDPEFAQPANRAKPVAVNRPNVGKSTPDVPVIVGQGASNETRVTIAGIPNLFVDEREYVVQFKPKFASDLRDFGSFGVKVLPDLVPSWTEVGTHYSSMRDAVTAAIRAASGCESTQSKEAPTRTHTAVEQSPVPDPAHETSSEPAHRPSRTVVKSVTARNTRRSSTDFHVGVIQGWGEETFPRREPKPGESATYQSFALRLRQADGFERVLQGEGLKDAITMAAAEIGESVKVHRLGKEAVAAFGDDGEPLFRDNVRVYWNRWKWRITR